MSTPEPERHGGFLCLWGPPLRVHAMKPYQIWVPLHGVGPVIQTGDKDRSKVWVNGTDFDVMGSAEQVVHWLHNAREEWLDESSGYEEPEEGD